MITEWPPLGRTKSKIVSLLFARQGRFVTCHELAKFAKISTSSVRVAICKINKKYGKNCIKNSTNQGYMI